MIRPVAPHSGHGRAIENSPWFTVTEPLPPQAGHVRGEVPGFAPAPPHVGHEAGPWIRSGTVTPAIASSNETRTSVSRSVPRAGERVLAPRPPNTLEKRSSMP